MKNSLLQFLKVAIITSISLSPAIWALVQTLDMFNVIEAKKYGRLGFIIISFFAIILGIAYSFIRTYRTKTIITFSIFDRVLSYLPLLLAIEAGFFRKRGIEINIICAHGDRETWSDVEKGTANFGLSDPIVMLNENAKGAQLIGTIVNKATLWGISGKRLPYFHSISEVPKNLTISGYEEPTTTFRALSHLKKTCEATIKCFKSGEEEEAASDPDVDIVMLPEPFASEWIEKRKGYSRVFDGPCVFDELTWSGIYCTKEYLKINSDSVQLVIDATHEALNYIKNNPIETQRIAIRIFHNFDVTAVCTATLRMLKQSVFPHELITSRIEWTDALKFWGLNDRKFLFDDYVNNSFAIAAQKRSQHGKLR